MTSAWSLCFKAEFLSGILLTETWRFQEHPLFECLIIGLMLMALIININKSKKFINRREMICTHSYHVATKWLWGVLECAEQGSKKYCKNCQYRVMYQWIIDLYSANLEIHSSLMNQISKRIELQPNCIVAPWIVDMHVSFFCFRPLVVNCFLTVIIWLRLHISLQEYSIEYKYS